MDQSIWQEIVREDAHKENLGSHNRHKGRVYAKERKSVSIVKGRERGGA